MLTYSPASADFRVQPELMACEQSPCVKPTLGAKPSSPKRGREYWSGQTLEPSAWVSPSKQDEVRGSLPPRPQDTGVPLNQMLASAWPTVQANLAVAGNKSRSADRKDELLLAGLVHKMSGFSQQAFHASLPAGPGSKEARAMTAGSGVRLLKCSNQSGPCGQFLKTLLVSRTWRSLEFNLKWTPKDVLSGIWELWRIEWDDERSTKFWKRLKRKDTTFPGGQTARPSFCLYQLAPSAPRTGECDTGLFASGWPTVTSRDGEHNPQASQATMKRNSRPLNEVLYAARATPKKAEGGPDYAKSERGLLPGGSTSLSLPTEIAGATTSGCLARTEKFVVRLTTLSAWLMGYTGQYLALWETASSGRSRRKLLKP
jgi:hypothetical protein